MEQNTFVKIEKGTVLPDDFLDAEKHSINRVEYVVEYGSGKDDIWFDEYLSPVTFEIIASIVMGSNFYNDIRYRRRKKDDKDYNKYDTLLAKIIQSTLIESAKSLTPKQ